MLALSMICKNFLSSHKIPISYKEIDPPTPLPHAPAHVEGPLAGAVVSFEILEAGAQQGVHRHAIHPGEGHAHQTSAWGDDDFPLLLMQILKEK